MANGTTNSYEKFDPLAGKKKNTLMKRATFEWYLLGTDT